MLDDPPMSLGMSNIPKSRQAIAEAFFDSCDEVICVSDFLGQYLACNQAFTAALGWPEKELLDLGFVDLAPDNEREEVLGLGAAIVRAGGQKQTYARPMRHRDGSYRLVLWTTWVDLSNRLVYGMGRVQGVVEIPG